MSKNNVIKTAHPVNLIILNELGQVLLVKRSSQDDFSGYWSIPGGGPIIDENYEKALSREITEELNCKIVQMQYFQSYYYRAYPHLHVRATYFFGTISGNIKLNDEATEYWWFDMVELPKLKLAYNQRQVLLDFVKFYKNDK